VDVGFGAGRPACQIKGCSSGVDTRAQDFLILIRNHMPTDKNSPHSNYLPGFTSISLLLQKACRTTREEEIFQSLQESYQLYKQGGCSASDIAWMIARDYMVLASVKVENFYDDILQDFTGHTDEKSSSIHHSTDEEKRFVQHLPLHATIAQQPP